MVYEPFELGGYRIPAGVDLIVSPLITQRDARWFDAPLEFRPERWTAEFREAVPQYAYPPFGGGPHKCIGEGFAWMEAKIALATLGQPRARLMTTVMRRPCSLISRYISLTPKGGMPVTLERRKGRLS